jgi:hypothetical protein
MLSIYALQKWFGQQCLRRRFKLQFFIFWFNYSSLDYWAHLYVFVLQKVQNSSQGIYHIIYVSSSCQQYIYEGSSGIMAVLFCEQILRPGVVVPSVEDSVDEISYTCLFKTLHVLLFRIIYMVVAIFCPYSFLHTSYCMFFNAWFLPQTYSKVYVLGSTNGTDCCIFFVN